MMSYELEGPGPPVLRHPLGAVSSNRIRERTIHRLCEMFPRVCPNWIEENAHIGRYELVEFIRKHVNTDQVTKRAGADREVDKMPNMAEESDPENQLRTPPRRGKISFRIGPKRQVVLHEHANNPPQQTSSTSMSVAWSLVKVDVEDVPRTRDPTWIREIPEDHLTVFGPVIPMDSRKCTYYDATSTSTTVDLRSRNFNYLTDLFPNVSPRYISRFLDQNKTVAADRILRRMDRPEVDKLKRKRVIEEDEDQQIIPVKRRKLFSMETGIDLERLKSTPEGLARYRKMLEELVVHARGPNLSMCDDEPSKEELEALKTRYHMVLPYSFRRLFLSNRYHWSDVRIITFLELLMLQEVDFIAEKRVVRPFHKEWWYKDGPLGPPQLADWNNNFPPGYLNNALHKVHRVMIDALRGPPEFTCGVCFEEIYEDDDYEACQTIESTPSEHHFFCKACLCGHSNACAEEGRVLANGAGIPCMEPGCPRHFTIASISAFLKTPALKVLEKKIQQAVLISSGVEVERCKYCNFEAEIGTSKEEDKVFDCSECRATFCRLCLMDWDRHIGLRCEEVETDEERTRKQLEEELSRAVIHTCTRCRLEYEKEDGCNLMTCTCLMTQCYACRKPNITYKHFCTHVRDPNQPGVCSEDCNRPCLLYQDVRKTMELRRQQIVQQAALEFGEEFTNKLA